MLCKCVGNRNHRIQPVSSLICCRDNAGQRSSAQVAQQFVVIDAQPCQLFRKKDRPRQVFVHVGHNAREQAPGACVVNRCVSTWRKLDSPAGPLPKSKAETANDSPVLPHGWSWCWRSKHNRKIAMPELRLVSFAVSSCSNFFRHSVALLLPLKLKWRTDRTLLNRFGAEFRHTS
jgi:hypothetical protein